MGTGIATEPHKDFNMTDINERSVEIRSTLLPL